MMLALRLTVTVLSVILLVGCGKGRVQVVDVNGDPIPGAQVEPVSLSVNGKPIKTDAKGEAEVPLFIGQEVVWVQASKPGYLQKQVDVPDSWPLIIVLELKDPQ